MEQRVVTVEDLCRLCLSSKPDSYSLIQLSERHAKQFKDLTKRELPLSQYYPTHACLQCCNDLENMYAFKNLLLQRQDELEIILQSCSVAEEYGEVMEEEDEFDEDNIIEEYLDDEYDDSQQQVTEEAQDLRTKFNEMPSVKNLSQTPNKTDILKLIEDIEKNNQLIYENSKPTILWKKRKPRSNKPKASLSETHTASVARSDALVTETPKPKLIMKPFTVVDSSAGKANADSSEGFVVYREKYLCSRCSQSFYSELSLKRHLKTHTTQLPVVCCNQVFDVIEDYKNHKRIIHNDSNFTCKCGKVLKSKKTYRIHLKSHLATSERKYKCHCSKAFNMKVHLENHMRIHLNQKPFECPLCSVAFKQKHQVSLHLRNKHNINSSSVAHASEIDEDTSLE